MSIDHYENFPVASFLCPPALRPAVVAIYHFARTADDIADEGHATAEQRLADLQSFRQELQNTATGQAPSPRWASVFLPLQKIMHQHCLPVPLLAKLLSAFEQDLSKTAYANREELLTYCEHSANPVGRLLLHLYGITDAQALVQSDQICTALQLINFWQDLSTDIPRERFYMPQTDCDLQGITPQQLKLKQDTPATQAVLATLAAWARELMHGGQPLVRTLPGRAGWELRLVIQGGLRVLKKIERMQYRCLNQRPTLKWHDTPSMLVHSLLMNKQKVTP
jgi:hydroxysqualene synthase